jgi:hypothetical protein
MIFRSLDFAVIFRCATALLAVVIFSLPWSPFAFAQDEGEQQKPEQQVAESKEAEKPMGEISADDTAKALANPAGSLANLVNNLTYTTYKGDLPVAGTQTSLTYTFQPVLPFPVGDKGRDIIVRPAFTVSFDQPVFDASTGQWDSLSTQFNDIVFDTVYAGTTMTSKSTGYLWGVGGGRYPAYRYPQSTWWRTVATWPRAFRRHYS